MTRHAGTISIHDQTRRVFFSSSKRTQHLLSLGSPRFQSQITKPTRGVAATSTPARVHSSYIEVEVFATQIHTLWTKRITLTLFILIFLVQRLVELRKQMCLWAESELCRMLSKQTYVHGIPGSQDHSHAATNPATHSIQSSHSTLSISQCGCWKCAEAYLKRCRTAIGKRRGDDPP